MTEFNWKHLEDVYSYLGLEDKDIQNERLATPDRRGQERKILHLWCDTKAERATRESMIAAMEQVPKCRAHLNKLKEKWNNRSPGKYDVMGTILQIEVWVAEFVINPITIYI